MVSYFTQGAFHVLRPEDQRAFFSVRRGNSVLNITMFLIKSCSCPKASRFFKFCWKIKFLYFSYAQIICHVMRCPWLIITYKFMALDLEKLVSSLRRFYEMDFVTPLVNLFVF